MQWQVKSIYDADTLTVVRGSEEKTIRLCGIDAPEIGQPLGVEARDYLRKVLDGETIHFNKLNEDRYGRTVADVVLIDRNIGTDLVRNGYAWVWDEYARYCPEYDELKKASDEAKSDQVGVFSSDSHIEPWIWRQRN
ncbi:MAG: thermonuclease family protein [Halothece sp.]